MADSIVTPEELLGKLLAGQEVDLLREAALAMLRELMEIDVKGRTGAALGERTPDRLCMRNGYRERRLDTRVGTLELPIPKLREGSYFPSFLEPRRRSEEALFAVIAEAYIKGVSTRKVEDLAHALGIDGISKSEVSRICARLDAQVEAFRGRPLVGRYPYLFLDATYEKVRDETARVVSMALVVAYGVSESGEREVLGLEVCRSEDYAFWRGFLAGLVSRGLAGVALVISDAHKGLKKAIDEVFLGASWQRCRVHFLRNLLSLVPKDGQGMVLAAVRLIFQQPDKERATKELRALCDRLKDRLPRVSAALLEAEEEILAHMDFPAEHWKQISSTNPLERLNKEINRRTRVVGIFPDDKSLIRLIGAVLAEQNDEWAVCRKYMSRHSLARIYQQATPEIEGEVTHAVAIPVH
ncbi:MAG: transposase [Acidobacteria bacterium RBG_16_64_8]|nr:MAG: transposase [Acidobacteria bacterium RBG_16_64_8]